MVTTDSLYEYRVARLEELGFSKKDAQDLAEATQIVIRESDLSKYEYEVPIYWKSIADMLEAGATHDQILRILL